MKLQFLTITIEHKCYDLPKDMQIPQRGSTVFIENKAGIVENINYHIIDGKVHMVNIFTTKP